MKKKIAVVLLVAVMLTLAACGSKAEVTPPATEASQTQETQTQATETQEPQKEEADIEADDPSSEPEYAGAYLQTWSEEIGGTVAERNSYIVLNEDHTGYVIAQEVGTLSWDEGQLTETIGVTYDIALEEENGTVNLLVYYFQDADGTWIPTKYEKINELPAEVEELLARF